MVKKILIIGGILALIATSGVYYVFNKPHAAAGSPDFFVVAKDLIDEFETNEDEANAKYLDKVVEVSGTVKEVIKKESAYIILLGDSTSFSRVSCTLDKDEGAMAYGIQSGDKITIKGICTGRLLDVVLTDCNLVEHGK
jgi:tRNA_anti-like